MNKDLYIAVASGQLEDVHRLIDAGANVNQAMNDDATPLFIAAQEGQLEVVNALLAANAEINQAVNNGETPLLAAAEKGHLEVVNALLAANAEINQAVNNGVTPLHLAAQEGQLEVVNALLAAGAAVDQARTDNGSTPLYVAIQQGHANIACILIKAKANVNVNLSIDIDATPLFIAAQEGQLEVVNALLAAGADVNLGKIDGITPLIIAAQEEQLEVVNALLAANAEINQAMVDGKTPLYIAAQFGHLQVVNALLAAGAAVDQAEINGVTPLLAAAEKGHLEVVNALLSANAEINQATNDGATPLFIAAQNGYIEVVNALLAANAEINQAMNNGATPLHAAAVNGHLEVVNALLAANAEINQAANNGATPLLATAEKGHLEVVNALLAANAEINQAINNGATPLFIAAQNGYLEVVNALLAANAEINQAMNNGATPLYVAAQNGHHEVVDALLSADADVTQAMVDGKTTLFAAVRSEHDLCVKLLLPVALKSGLQKSDYKTIFSFAVKKNNVAIIQLLINAGAEPHQFISGVTALLQSVTNTKANIVMDADSINRYLLAQPDSTCLTKIKDQIVSAFIKANDLVASRLEDRRILASTRFPKDYNEIDRIVKKEQKHISFKLSFNGISIAFSSNIEELISGLDNKIQEIEQRHKERLSQIDKEKELTVSARANNYWQSLGVYCKLDEKNQISKAEHLILLGPSQQTSIPSTLFYKMLLEKGYLEEQDNNSLENAVAIKATVAQICKLDIRGEIQTASTNLQLLITRLTQQYAELNARNNLIQSLEKGLSSLLSTAYKKQQNMKNTEQLLKLKASAEKGLGALKTLDKMRTNVTSNDAGGLVASYVILTDALPESKIRDIIEKCSVLRTKSERIAQEGLARYKQELEAIKNVVIVVYGKTYSKHFQSLSNHKAWASNLTQCQSISKASELIESLKAAKTSEEISFALNAIQNCHSALDQVAEKDINMVLKYQIIYEAIDFINQTWGNATIPKFQKVKYSEIKKSLTAKIAEFVFRVKDFLPIKTKKWEEAFMKLVCPTPKKTPMLRKTAHKREVGAAASGGGASAFAGASPVDKMTNARVLAGASIWPSDSLIIDAGCHDSVLTPLSAFAGKLLKPSNQDLPNLIEAKRSMIRHYLGAIQSQNPTNANIKRLHGILGHQLQFFQTADQALFNQLLEIISNPVHSGYQPVIDGLLIASQDIQQLESSDEKKFLWKSLRENKGPGSDDPITMIAHILKYLDSSFPSCDSDIARDVEKYARVDALFTLKKLWETRPRGHDEALFRQIGTREQSDIKAEITRYTSKRNEFRHDDSLMSKTIGDIYNELFPHHALDHTVTNTGLCASRPGAGRQ